MKFKGYYLFLIPALVLGACNQKKELTPREVEEYVTIAGFEKEGTSFSIKVDNDINTFSFNGKVKIPQYYTYMVYEDKAHSRNVDLDKVSIVEGSSDFFMVVYKQNKGIASFDINFYRYHMYTVSYSTMLEEEIPDERVQEGNKATKPDDPIVEGFTFKGWNYDFDNPITKDTKITADYDMDVYNITYDLVGGEFTSDNVYYSYTVVTPTYTLPTPVKVGYKFKGWFDGKTEYKTIVKGSTGDVSVTAKWSADIKPFKMGDNTFAYFGTYPQTYVSNQRLAAELDGIFQNTTATRLTYDGYDYVKMTVNKSLADAKFNNGDNVANGKTCYFKCEPVLWKVLQTYESDTKIYTMTPDSILDCSVFNTTNDDNNYTTSSIRSYLNSTFLQNTFSSNDIANRFKTHNVANSADQHAPECPYDYPQTKDKVFLLSYLQVNGIYASSAARMASASDYAIARGIELNNANSTYASYWTRSPSNEEKKVLTINENGEYAAVDATSHTLGFRPILTADLISEFAVLPFI